jgi:hypothetical protein
MYLCVQIASGVKFGEGWLRESLAGHTSQLISMCQRLMASNGKPLGRSIMVGRLLVVHAVAPPRREACGVEKEGIGQAGYGLWRKVGARGSGMNVVGTVIAGRG